MTPVNMLLVDGGAFVLAWLVYTLTPEHWTGVHRTALAICVGDWIGALIASGLAK